MKYIPIFVAAIAVSSAISGLVDINLEHHLRLPPELSNKTIISEHTILNKNGSYFTSKVIDIRMSSEIKGTDTVKDIARVLQEAEAGDIINFHLAGIGGEIDTVFYIINNIKNSKAYVKMIVEAPVYSGHAYIATAGNELVMLPYTYLMFHTSSAYGEDCSKATGMDRTVLNSEHCYAELGAHLKAVEGLIDQIKILTPIEKERIKTGHDVYIHQLDYQKRLEGNHEETIPFIIPRQILSPIVGTN